MATDDPSIRARTRQGEKIINPVPHPKNPQDCPSKRGVQTLQVRGEHCTSGTGEDKEFFSWPFAWNWNDHRCGEQHTTFDILKNVQALCAHLLHTIGLVAELSLQGFGHPLSAVRALAG